LRIRLFADKRNRYEEKFKEKLSELQKKNVSFAKSSLTTAALFIASQRNKVSASLHDAAHCCATAHRLLARWLTEEKVKVDRKQLLEFASVSSK
jgi:hypothetical protein